ncbi:MAG: hypothetical protein V4656_18155, partial [Pseudomonadota bacterium]
LKHDKTLPFDERKRRGQDNWLKEIEEEAKRSGRAAVVQLHEWDNGQTTVVLVTYENTSTGWQLIHRLPSYTVITREQALQRMIDYKERPADFLTLYVYLHPVTRQDAPLFLLKGSHRLGGTVFPHDLTATSEASWTYRDGRGGAVETDQLILTGGAGFTAMWHACTLHGTQPDAADHERISLRYLLAQGPGRAGMDEVNATLDGPLILTETRTDLAADGRAQVKRNTINQA